MTNDKDRPILDDKPDMVKCKVGNIPDYYKPEYKYQRVDDPQRQWPDNCSEHVDAIVSAIGAEDKYPPFDAALTYQAGDKVMLGGHVATIGDISDVKSNRELKFRDEKETLIDRLRASHKAASELPEMINELREFVGSIGYDLVARDPFVGAEPEPDMTDWRNWREGDEVIAINGSVNHYTVGKIYRLRDDPSNGNARTVTDDKGSTTNGWTADNFRFHSRPTKEQDK